MATTKKTNTELTKEDLEYLWNLCVADAGSCRDYGDERKADEGRASAVASKLEDLHKTRS